MKKLIIITLFLTTLMSCNLKKQQHIKPKVGKYDTIIKLSKTRYIYFKRDTQELVGKLYDRYLITNKGDTLGNFPATYISTWVTVSPNKRFAIMENILRAYIEDENDSTFLQENYLCDLIDLNNGEFIDGYQTHCGGEWNSKNQWVDGDGSEIIFDPKRDLK